MTAVSVYDNLADFKASAIAAVSAVYDRSLWSWATGDFTGQADDTSIVESDNAPLTTGAWVRQKADAVTFRQAGTGAVTRTSRDKMRETVSVKDFGAEGDGVSDDTAAFLAARDYLQTNSDLRGGRIIVPPGVYCLSDEWAFTPYATGQVFNIMIQGAGMEATVLDFAGEPNGKHGISARGHGSDFFVSDLSIKNAKGIGVLLKGDDVGSSSFIQRCGLSNVRIQGSGGHGFYSENSFMLSLDHVLSFGNGGAGIFFAGYHTSVQCRVCWARDNDDAGWRLNGLVYSELISCGSDANLWGYRITNCNALKLSSCGAEDSHRDNIAVETSDASAVGLPADAQDVCMTIDSFFATRGSTVTPNLYANFLSCLTADARPITITIGGCVSRVGTSTADALVLNGASGTVDVWGYTTTGNSFDSGNYIAGAATLH